MKSSNVNFREFIGGLSKKYLSVREILEGGSSGAVTKQTFIDIIEHVSPEEGEELLKMIKAVKIQEGAAEARETRGQQNQEEITVPLIMSLSDECVELKKQRNLSGSQIKAEEALAHYKIWREKHECEEMSDKDTLMLLPLLVEVAERDLSELHYEAVEDVLLRVDNIPFLEGESFSKHDVKNLLLFLERANFYQNDNNSKRIKKIIGRLGEAITSDELYYHDNEICDSYNMILLQRLPKNVVEVDEAIGILDKIFNLYQKRDAASQNLGAVFISSYFENIASVLNKMLKSEDQADRVYQMIVGVDDFVTAHSDDHGRSPILLRHFTDLLSKDKSSILTQFKKVNAEGYHNLSNMKISLKFDSIRIKLEGILDKLKAEGAEETVNYKLCDDDKIKEYVVGAEKLLLKLLQSNFKFERDDIVRILSQTIECFGDLGCDVNLLQEEFSKKQAQSTTKGLSEDNIMQVLFDYMMEMKPTSNLQQSINQKIESFRDYLAQETRESKFAEGIMGSLEFVLENSEEGELISEVQLEELKKLIVLSQDIPASSVKVRDKEKIDFSHLSLRHPIASL